MPELPEVETVVRTLENQIKDVEISKVVVYWPRIVSTDLNEFKSKLEHQHFREFKRRGKYLLFVLDDTILVSHLRMEGKFFYTNHDEPLNKHVHVVFQLKNGKELRYHDTRKFGRMELVNKDIELDTFKGLGPEPWDLRLTEEYCKRYLKNKSIPIKQVLLDQKFIAGIGNIYADEICFMMEVDPRKPANKLTKKNRIDLIEATQTVLAKAIQCGGTTIRSYTSSLGVTGRFQLEVNVHGKKGETCPRCGNTIQKITVATRGTYFCRNVKRGNMKKIAITGTIGSGKSECCRILQGLGYSVFDCDAQVRKLYDEDIEMVQSIVSLFGDSIIHANIINKKKIAELIFSNLNLKSKLESIVLPKLKNKLIQAMSKSNEELFFAEVPLLFEIGWSDMFDTSLLIISDEKNVLQRLMNSRDYTLDEAMKRINHQMSINDKKLKANYVIENNENMNEFEKQIKIWLETIMEDR